MTTMRKLRALAIAAHYKINKNRSKDLTVAGKWERGAHDEEGNRTWTNASMGFLMAKLCEEMLELMAATKESKANSILYEGADVSAMAMMVVDRSINWNTEDTLLPPKVVCLCGSTRFPDAFMKANFQETMAGNIVLSVGSFMHSDSELKITAKEKIQLDELHKRKIDLADEILVLNVHSYIGDSTRSEIAYAQITGKEIRYLEPNGQKNNET